MKTLINIFIAIIIFLLGCNQSNQNQLQTMETQPITLYNSYEFQMPIGFIKEDGHNWIYNNQREKKLGRLYLSQFENPKGDVIQLLDDFQKEMFEGSFSDYELLNSDTLKTSKKEGVIRNYRKNENENKLSTIAVYTYHSIGIVKFANNIFKIRSFSIGFNLNPTVNKVFFQLQHNDDPLLDLGQEVDLQKMNVYESHFIGIPKKYHFDGTNTIKSLELRYKNPNNNITYYLTSYQMEHNTELGYYLESYRSNLINDGYLVSDTSFYGHKALKGKLQIESIYIYQLHFANLGKALTIQILAGKMSQNEFEQYINDVIILK